MINLCVRGASLNTLTLTLTLTLALTLTLTLRQMERLQELLAYAQDSLPLPLMPTLPLTLTLSLTLTLGEPAVAALPPHTLRLLLAEARPAISPLYLSYISPTSPYISPHHLPSSP